MLPRLRRLDDADGTAGGRTCCADAVSTDGTGACMTVDEEARSASLICVDRAGTSVPLNCWAASPATGTIHRVKAVSSISRLMVPSEGACGTAGSSRSASPLASARDQRHARVEPRLQ